MCFRVENLPTVPIKYTRKNKKANYFTKQTNILYYKTLLFLYCFFPGGNPKNKNKRIFFTD